MWPVTNANTNTKVITHHALMRAFKLLMVGFCEPYFSAKIEPTLLAVIKIANMARNSHHSEKGKVILPPVAPNPTRLGGCGLRIRFCLHRAVF